MKPRAVPCIIQWWERCHYIGSAGLTLSVIPSTQQPRSGYGCSLPNTWLRWNLVGFRVQGGSSQGKQDPNWLDLARPMRQLFFHCLSFGIAKDPVCPSSLTVHVAVRPKYFLQHSTRITPAMMPGPLVPLLPTRQYLGQYLVDFLSFPICLTGDGEGLESWLKFMVTV